MSKRLSMMSAIAVLSLSAQALSADQVYAADQCQAIITEPLEKVGETRLRVYFFRVYDAILYTDSGIYPDAQSVALELTCEILTLSNLSIPHVMSGKALALRLTSRLRIGSILYRPYGQM